MAFLYVMFHVKRIFALHAQANIRGFGMVAAFHFLYQSLQFGTVIIGQSFPAANQGNEVGADMVEVRFAAQSTSCF